MLHSDDGGRMRPIIIDAQSRYMPHLVIDDRNDRVSQDGVNGVRNRSELTSSFALSKRVGTRRAKFEVARFAHFSSPEGGTKTAVGVSRRLGWITLDSLERL